MRLTAIASLLPTCSAGLWALPAVTPAPALADIAADIRQQCAQGAFSGLVIVTRGSRRLMQVACQPPDSPRITFNTRFKLFSMSKMFTGNAIAILIERGRIDPDAAISRYIEHLPAAWRAVKVRELLEHSSGIPDLTERLLDQFTDGGATDHRMAVNRLLRKVEGDNPPLAFAPSSKWAYNNFGYELLAQIGATVTGKSFDRVLHELVLDPAGMKTAVIAMPRFRKGKLDGSRDVPGLIQGYNGVAGKVEPATSLSFVQLGAGGVVGAAADLIAYDRALRAGRPLSSAMQARSMADAYRVNERVSYGYGVMHRTSGGCAVVQHSGGTNGYVSDFARVPQREIAVIILSNFGFANISPLRAKLVDRLTAAQPCKTV